MIIAQKKIAIPILASLELDELFESYLIAE
jgi:hypothetical protein